MIPTGLTVLAIVDAVVVCLILAWYAQLRREERARGLFRPQLTSKPPKPKVSDA